VWSYQDGANFIYPDQYEPYRDFIPEVSTRLLRIVYWLSKDTTQIGWSFHKLWLKY